MSSYEVKYEEPPTLPAPIGTSIAIAAAAAEQQALEHQAAAEQLLVQHHHDVAVGIQQQHQQHQQAAIIQYDEHGVPIGEEDPNVDYGAVKHLRTSAESEQQQAAAQLSHAEKNLQKAQRKYEEAKANNAKAIGKISSINSQFRTQIMEEGLRQQSRWNNMYHKLLEWKEGHNGDTTVPCDAKTATDEIKKLNRWVVNQRSAYKYWCNGDKKHIKDHRVDALNKIGFVWSVNDHIWDTNYEELRQFHAQHGNFNPTHKQNRKLAQFSARLRTAFSHKENGLVQQELTDDRIKRLNDINFSWEMKRKPRKTATHDTSKFDVMYEHLVSFKEHYGHLKVNKLEKEWKANNSATLPTGKKVWRRLPLFTAFIRKEELAFRLGQPTSLDGEKVRLLTELGMEWKMDPTAPRKSTGGESSRKKRKLTAEQTMDGLVHHQYQQQQVKEEEAAEAAQQAQEAAMGVNPGGEQMAVGYHYENMVIEPPTAMAEADPMATADPTTHAQI